VASSDAATSGPSAANPRKAGRAVAGVGDLHSSVDLADIKTAGERREGACPTASQRGEGPDDGRGDELWIKTSPKVRKLQRVLYRKAKAEPRWRFYSLYGELYRRDILSDALDQRASRKGPWRCLLISARSSIREAFFRAGPYRFKPNVRRTLTDAESTTTPRPLLPASYAFISVEAAFGDFTE
jgi:hypothetical protein